MVSLTFPVMRAEGQSIQRIECVKCGATDRNVLTGNRASDETLVSFFRRRGWDVDTKHGRNLCPECFRKGVQLTRAQKQEKKMESVKLVQPSQNSALAKKIMSDLLFDHYDITAQDYKPGWDDAKIAKESGLSEQFVSQRRASDYGPCSPPRKALMAEASGMSSKVVAMLKELSELAGNLQKRSGILLTEAERLAGILSDEAKKASVGRMSS